MMTPHNRLPRGLPPSDWRLEATARNFAFGGVRPGRWRIALEAFFGLMQFGFALVLITSGPLRLPLYMQVTLSIIVIPAIVLLVKMRLGRVSKMDRAWRRMVDGLCPYCGYDLRDCTDRCSECGRMIPSVVEKVLQWRRAASGSADVVDDRSKPE
jgi:hypothetical protein